jgi:hypothetical protein
MSPLVRPQPSCVRSDGGTIDQNLLVYTAFMGRRMEELAPNALRGSTNIAIMERFFPADRSAEHRPSDPGFAPRVRRQVRAPILGLTVATKATSTARIVECTPAGGGDQVSTSLQAGPRFHVAVAHAFAELGNVAFALRPHRT